MFGVGVNDQSCRRPRHLGRRRSRFRRVAGLLRLLGREFEEYLGADSAAPQVSIMGRARGHGLPEQHRDEEWEQITQLPSLVFSHPDTGDRIGNEQSPTADESCHRSSFAGSALMRSNPGRLVALPASRYGVLGRALSCFFCSCCFCFVTSCCLFFSLSFLPPLSPMPAPFQPL